MYRIDCLGVLAAASCVTFRTRSFFLTPNQSVRSATQLPSFSFVINYKWSDANHGIRQFAKSYLATAENSPRTQYESQNEPTIGLKTIGLY
jgi:hypothetical protein